MNDPSSASRCKVFRIRTEREAAKLTDRITLHGHSLVRFHVPEMDGRSRIRAGKPLTIRRKGQRLHLSVMAVEQD
jgi:hypothetical protein